MAVRRTASVIVTAVVVLTALTIALITLTGRQDPIVSTVDAEPVAMAQAPPSEQSSEQATEHASEHAPTAPPADTQAATLQMQSLLGHHVTLGIRFMRATVNDDPGFVDAANASLVRHIGDIERALEPLAGAEQAAEFGDRWEQHTQSLFQYAQAARDDDETAREQAGTALATDVDDLSAILEDLTDGNLARPAAREALESMTQLLTEQIDAYAAEDYERAYQLERDVYAMSSGVGQTLAEAAMGNTPGTVEYTPREQLAGSLAMLMGEHVELAVDAMRAGVNGDPEFEAAAGAVDANTRAVTDAMSSMFGDDTARQFNRLWADHIDLFIDYTAARAAGDDEAMTRARDEFDQVVRQFGSALATISDGALSEDAVNEVLTAHEMHLLDQIDVYAGDDYERAHDIAYTAYQHMRDVALVLADGFAEAIGDEMPAGGADTGGGATSHATKG